MGIFDSRLDHTDSCSCKSVNTWTVNQFWRIDLLRQSLWRVKLCKTQRIHFDTISGCDASAIKIVGNQNRRRSVGDSKRTLKFKIEFLLTDIMSPTTCRRLTLCRRQRVGDLHSQKKAARYSRRQTTYWSIAARLPIDLPLFSFANHIGYWTGVRRQSLRTL